MGSARRSGGRSGASSSSSSTTPSSGTTIPASAPIRWTLVPAPAQTGARLVRRPRLPAEHRRSGRKRHQVEALSRQGRLPRRPATGDDGPPGGDGGTRRRSVPLPGHRSALDGERVPQLARGLLRPDRAQPRPSAANQTTRMSLRHIYATLRIAAHHPTRYIESSMGTGACRQGLWRRHQALRGQGSTEHRRGDRGSAEGGAREALRIASAHRGQRVLSDTNSPANWLVAGGGDARETSRVSFLMCPFCVSARRSRI
jgi:hypothetical protein